MYLPRPFDLARLDDVGEHRQYRLIGFDNAVVARRVRMKRDDKPVISALVNAVKELKAQIDALRGERTADSK
jgi:hypothetical protein